MILRRPYAFLIKHFRIIHLILFILLAFITVKANNILSFFKDYISANGNIEVISSNYINYFIFVSSILIIALSITILYLMKYKKKPKALYIIIIIVSILSMFVTVYLYMQIKKLEVSSMSAINIRLLRDISRFNYWALFILCIPILIRGLGFDIKKFNFAKDVQELNLSEEDREEVEVKIGIDKDEIKRGGRRLSRELKYYYIENKFFINIILGVALLILIIMFPFNKFVINGDLNEKEVLKTTNFNMKVTDSYISERNRTSKNNCYLILRISVLGKSNKYNLKLDELVLEGKEDKYIPSLKYYYYFDDIGTGYKNNKLNTSNYEDYILIYNIDKKDSSSNLKLNYIVNDRKIKLKPEILD